MGQGHLKMFSFGASASQPQQPQPSAQTQPQQPTTSFQFQPQQSQQPNTSLFGSGANTQATVNNNQGSFQPQTSQTSQTSLFGQQPSNLFGSNLFGQQSALPAVQSLKPAATATGVPYAKDTQFMDLPQEVRDALQELDNQMIQHAELGQQLAQRRIEEALERLERGRESAEGQAEALDAAIQAAQGRLEQAKRATNQNWRVGDAASRLLSASRRVEGGVGLNPVPLNATTPGSTANAGKVIYSRMPAGLGLPPLLEPFLAETASRLQHRLDELSQLATTIRSQLEAASAASTQRTNGEDALPALRQCLLQQHQALLSLTNRLAPLHSRIQQQRQAYREFITRYRHDHRDPFKEHESTISRMIPPENPPSNAPGLFATSATLNAAPAPSTTTATSAGPAPVLNQPLFGVSLPSATTNLFKRPS